MATKRVARPLSGAPRKRAIIEYSTQAGLTYARLRDRESRLYIGIVKGPPAFTRAVARAFAGEWERAQAEAEGTINGHELAIASLKRRVVERATRAAKRAGRDFGGVSDLRKLAGELAGGS